jgi:hypothetical protein
MIYMGNESDQTAGTTEEVYLDSFDKMIAAVNGFASDVTGKQSHSVVHLSVQQLEKPHAKYQLSNHPPCIVEACQNTR